MVVWMKELEEAAGMGDETVGGLRDKELEE